MEVSELGEVKFLKIIILFRLLNQNTVLASLWLRLEGSKDEIK